jgi:hypothetical protein
MDKYRETKYFKVYDMETIEKRISNDDLEQAEDGYFRYFDMRDRKEITMEVNAPLLVKTNMYSYIVYDTLKLPNEVVMIGYNSSNYHLNFILNMLHNPPE